MGPPLRFLAFEFENAQATRPRAERWHTDGRQIPRSLLFRGRYLYCGRAIDDCCLTRLCSQVLESDPAYCIWVSQLRDPTRCFRELQTYLATVGVLNPQQYEDSDDDSDGSEYGGDVGWIHPPAALPLLYEEEEPPPKAARNSQVDTEKLRADLLKNPEDRIELRACVVCCDLPAKVLFRRCGAVLSFIYKSVASERCGHVCCCAECALDMRDDRCPICRAPVVKEEGDIIRVYAG